ncbi:hypothetical protein [Microbacterium hydrocarbonoxydans]|uniref:hypothetical protein n=1 Tax=Microbacterium hydrocarbonoxydans TaxID=273678 RepID=UPI003D95FA64
MTESAREAEGTGEQESLQPLLGALDLLGGSAAAGYCSGGVCHYPAPSVEKGE